MFFIRQTIIHFTFPQTVTRRVLYIKKKKKKKKRDHCHNLNTNTLINLFFFLYKSCTNYKINLLIYYFTIIFGASGGGGDTCPKMIGDRWLYL